MAVIFLFVDGLGLGSAGDHNPVEDVQWRSFSYLSGGQGLVNRAEGIHSETLIFRGIDANLGLAGLPQSGTGQATLFSGVNAAALAGRHFGPFLHSRTIELLQSDSLFHKVIRIGKKPVFINAYPESYIQRLRQSGRWNCTTLMAVSSGAGLNGVDEIRNGSALTGEIDQRVWREKLHLQVPDITPEEAAERLIRRAEQSDLLLYEYYMTDKAGHSRDVGLSRRVLSVLDRFIDRIIATKRREDVLVICSDHGNLEDLRTRSHTRNSVPLIVLGPNLEGLQVPESISGVTELIICLLTRQAGSGSAATNGEPGKLRL